MKTLIRNAIIVNEGEKFRGSVLIENDSIAKIIKDDSLPEYDQLIDATGLLLIPGVIDDQVHFREPGLTHKAEIYTEARAAIAGGVTSFMEMPNTIPQTTTISLLEEKFKRASEVSAANYSFYIGATNDNLEEVLKADPKTVCGIKCFMGSSTGNMLVEGKPLENLFKYAHMLMAVHCEEEVIVKKNSTEYFEKYGEDIPIKYHPLIRSAEACYTSSAKAVKLAKKYGTRLHILHLSTAREMELFEPGNIENKQITAEVCVHHLWFDESDYEKKGALIKWNPAVKTANDKNALREALKTGRIDVVATDHAPHTIEEKENTYFKCPSGGPLVQHSLPAMLELVSQGVFTYNDVVEKMCHAPARLFNIEKRGYIREGYKADLTILSTRKAWTVHKNNIEYKCKWSPFDGCTFNHKVEYTLVNGHIAYKKGVFDESKKGERLRFAR
ncbi:MAG: dihydroorotase [Prolixibacteraceae bacterium]|nr:dihydroorotase [Prolixibacteraceae bacterium]MBN2648683.1 dihydroorotase [Prolixibacteraceae bacterium]